MLASGSTPQSPDQRVFMIIFCIVSSFNCMLSCLTALSHTSMARYGLFVLKVLLVSYYAPPRGH